MSEKREVLKVLEADYRAKRDEISDKYKGQILTLEKTKEKAIECRKTMIFKLVSNALKPLGAKIETDNIKIDNHSYSDIFMNMDKDKKFGEAQKALEKVEKNKQEELDGLYNKKNAIQRKIALYGVSPEILKMIEEL
jgi:hypothetical protein